MAENRGAGGIAGVGASRSFVRASHAGLVGVALTAVIASMPVEAFGPYNGYGNHDSEFIIVGKWSAKATISATALETLCGFISNHPYICDPTAPGGVGTQTAYTGMQLCEAGLSPALCSAFAQKGTLTAHYVHDEFEKENRVPPQITGEQLQQYDEAAVSTCAAMTILTAEAGGVGGAFCDVVAVKWKGIMCKGGRCETTYIPTGWYAAELDWVKYTADEGTAAGLINDGRDDLKTFFGWVAADREAAHAARDLFIDAPPIVPPDKVSASADVFLPIIPDVFGLALHVNDGRNVIDPEGGRINFAGRASNPATDFFPMIKWAVAFEGHDPPIWPTI